eukprot:EG_transcript_44907
MVRQGGFTDSVSEEFLDSVDDKSVVEVCDLKIVRQKLERMVAISNFDDFQLEVVNALEELFLQFHFLWTYVVDSPEGSVRYNLTDLDFRLGYIEKNWQGLSSEPSHLEGRMAEIETRLRNLADGFHDLF